MLRKNLNTQDTIFSLASGALPSAVAIIKISGSLAFEIKERIFFSSSHERELGQITKSRGMEFGELKDLKGFCVDKILCLSFVAPQSHTGEDTIEFHCHGSMSVVEKIRGLLLEMGVQPASRGEFSYRALINNRINPEQIDQLADVFAATTEQNLSKIYARKSSDLEKTIEALRKKMIQTQAVLDTAVDFSEEYSSVYSVGAELIKQIIHECSQIISRYETIKTGSTDPRVVIVGTPNAGKSSLFNMLLGRYRAIVSPEAGTTRDVIEEKISLEGRSWILVDTAGFRETESSIEKEGIELGKSFLEAASFWILMVDGTKGISAEEDKILTEFGDKSHLIVWNKKDLANWRECPLRNDNLIVSVSLKEGMGCDTLFEKLTHELGKKNQEPVLALPTQTQSIRLKETEVLLNDCLTHFANNQFPPEIIGEQIRLAMGKLDTVMGPVTQEEVLGRIFGEFCIGK